MNITGSIKAKFDYQQLTSTYSFSIIMKIEAFQYCGERRSGPRLLLPWGRTGQEVFSLLHWA